MKNTMKVIVLGASLVLPMASFAADATTAAPAPAMKAAPAKSANMKIVLEGAKSENTAELIKVAKEAGASKASFNAKTSTLTVSGSKFSKDKFTSSLSSSLPAVSVKN